MAKNNFTAIMSLLAVMATVMVCAMASSSEQIKSPSSSEQIKSSSSSEQIKSPSSSKHSKSSEHEKSSSTKNFRPRWSPEEVENLNDNQLKELAASLMSDDDVPISFHNHPQHKCWMKCALEKVAPYCDHLLTQSMIQGCLLAGGKACNLYCTGLHK